MNEHYLVIKWLHVAGAAILFGTGLGIAFHLWIALRGRNVVAIASPLAARSHGLAILADEISDHPENLTRFVSLARFTRLDHDAHTEWHTALRLITKHEPGALHDAIEPLRYHDVQMTSLHSRPIMGEPWRYQFYVDVVGHRSAPRVLRALKDVSERSAELHVLGSYPVSRGVQ